MNQRVWGPHAWRVIHTVFHHQPVNVKHAKLQKELSELTCSILPCSVCVHCCLHNKAKTDTDELPVLWFKIHNNVNTRNGTRVVSRKEFDRYHYRYDQDFFHSLDTFLVFLAVAHDLQIKSLPSLHLNVHKWIYYLFLSIYQHDQRNAFVRNGLLELCKNTKPKNLLSFLRRIRNKPESQSQLLMILNTVADKNNNFIEYAREQGFQVQVSKT